jgi:delta1-piperideine-2-carboxylate reductase
MDDTTILDLKEIDTLVRRVLLASGANAETAEVIAEVIMSAERDGPKSHGLAGLPSYAMSIRDGWADGCADPYIEVRAASAIHVDGANGYAQIAMRRIRSQAVEMARLNGCAVLALRNIHHIGPLGPDIEPFADQGLCALAFVNSAALLVPWQGDTAAFGTNPMAFACPRPDGSPIVWDQASSVFSFASIGQTRAQGETLSDVAGLDLDGVPTRDPAKILDARRLLPFAQHKGTAIALMVEILAAALTGGTLGVQERPDDEPKSASKDCGQLVIVLDPDLIGGHSFAESILPLLEALSDNGASRIPGDGRLARRAHAEAAGVDVDAGLLRKIEDLMA